MTDPIKDTPSSAPDLLLQLMPVHRAVAKTSSSYVIYEITVVGGELNLGVSFGFIILKFPVKIAGGYAHCSLRHRRNLT